jgi:hypothetical protein
VIRPSLLVFLVTLATFVLSAPAWSVPTVVSQTPVENVPGEIIAWQDSIYFSLTREGQVAQKLHRVRRASGNAVSYQIGKMGRGFLVAIDPAARVFIARETDSLGVHQLQKGTLPYLQWAPLFPVTDTDPHVTWFPDGEGFLYQDILDDSIGTPCVFRSSPNSAKPALYLIGGTRPLMAPTGDALAVVAADTVNPGPTRDIEQRQPVGIEDLKAGEFRWVAPLRTHVPKRGAWSPDGSQLALVSYAVTKGQNERRLYVYSRETGKARNLVLPGDVDKPDRDHAIDVASWSPGGQWVAVGRMAGAIWLANRGANQLFELKPAEGEWRGAPMWIDDTRLLIANEATTPGAQTGKYWIVEVGGL